MSIVSSRPSKNHNLVDVLFVFFALTLVLLVLAPSNGNSYDSNRIAPGTIERTWPDTPTSENLSFASDQQYWTASCGRGWSSDARCDFIVARTQSCSISVKSAYCSAYEKYLQEYRGK